MTPSGRVCGIAIGMALRPMLRRTPSCSASNRTAVVNFSQRRSGSRPASNRNGVPAVSRKAQRLSSGSAYSEKWSVLKVMSGRRDR